LIFNVENIVWIIENLFYVFLKIWVVVLWVINDFWNSRDIYKFIILRLEHKFFLKLYFVMGIWSKEKLFLQLFRIIINQLKISTFGLWSHAIILFFLHHFLFTFGFTKQYLTYFLKLFKLILFRLLKVETRIVFKSYLI